MNTFFDFASGTRELKVAKIVNASVSLLMLSALIWHDAIPDMGGNDKWRDVSLWWTWGVGTAFICMGMGMKHMRELKLANTNPENREMWGGKLYIIDRTKDRLMTNTTWVCTILYTVLFVADLVLGRMLGLAHEAMSVYVVLIAVCICMGFGQRKDNPGINYNFAFLCLAGVVVSVTADLIR